MFHKVFLKLAVSGLPGSARERAADTTSDGNTRFSEAVEVALVIVADRKAAGEGNAIKRSASACPLFYVA